MKKINLQIVYDGDKKASGYIQDITYAGLGIICSKNIPAATEVCLTPGANDLVKFNGKIIYCIKMEGLRNKYRVGIKFTSSVKKQTDSLASFIEEFNRREFSKLVGKL